MTTVVIAQFGACWDELAVDACGPGRQLIVLAQHRGEDVQRFRTRLAKSLDHLRRGGVSLERVVLVPAEGPEANVFSLLVRIDLMQLVVSKLEQPAAPC